MRRIVLIIGLITVGIMGLQAQVPAFPGAEGFGANATGGRGGNVIYVTNLNDSGTGSLRAAIQTSGKRTVVFKVSGTIVLNSRLSISNDDITIAGQTAPGEGITLKDYPLYVSANNVIVRFIRSRLGDVSGTEDDAMGGRNRSNIIIDHCSMSWSVDECASFYDNTNFTMQYCMIYESLYHSVHDKGNHGYGGIWGGKGATFHHNLLAHHTSRNPRFCGSRYSNQADLELIDHRNNVIYNWGDNSCYAAEGGKYNFVGNYYKYGPATSTSIRDRIIQPWADNGGNAQPEGVTGWFYINDNYIYKHSTTTEHNWNGVDLASNISTKEEIKLNSPVAVPAITEHSAPEAFEHVLARAGCIVPYRDELDLRVIQETRTGTVNYGGIFRNSSSPLGIIDTQSTVGGWPSLSSETAPADADSDGMPDAWEDANGLDKNLASDRNIVNGEGYTNLELYLNSLVEAYDYILRPINLAVDTIITLQVKLTWEDISDNETGFVIERKDGDTWSEINTTAENVTQYTDNGISTYADYYYRVRAINSEMESYPTDSLRVRESALGITDLEIDNFHLKVYPNPFRDNATIQYTLREAASLKLSILDISGRETILLTGERVGAGLHNYTLDANNLENGVYYIMLKVDESIRVSKVILAR